MSTPTYEPTSEDVANAGTITSWRIADGKIRTGRPEDDNEVILDHVVGLPIRFGIVPEGMTKEGIAIPEKFRIVLKRAETGESFSLHMRLDSTQARNLMGALSLWDNRSYLSISPNRSDKPNKYGKHVTYVNVKQCEGPNKWVSLRFDMSGMDWADVPGELADELAAFPEWKPWTPRGEEEQGGPWEEMSDWLTSQGFESYRGQLGYKAILEKGLKKASVDDFTADDWAKAKATMEAACKRGMIPDDLKAATPPVASEADYDPFAD